MFLLAADDHAHAADAAHGAAAHGAAHAHAEPKPLDHVVDMILFRGSDGTPLLTMHMLTLLAAAILTVLTLWYVSTRIRTGPESDGHRRFVPKGRLAQLLEVVILTLRDEMIRPMLGDAHTARYTPFLLTIFFFILFNNLLGLLPLLSVQHLIGGVGWGDWHWAVLGGTATGNIAVTAGLAVIAFVAIQVHAFRDLGLRGWAHHLLGGAPWWLAPLMVPVEIVGMIIKPAALAIRLFANMLAGHTLMATVLLFGYMGLNAGLGWLVGGGVVGGLSAIFGVALMFLELFVACLQAFVFMFLTTVFISLMSHHDEHEHEHEHEHHHAHGGAEAAHAH